MLDIVFVIVLALVFSAILAAGLGWRHPSREGFWPGSIFLFIVLLLTIWAGGIWIPAAGPTLWGVGWLPYVAIGLLVALLLLAAASPAKRPRTSREALREANEAAAAGLVFGLAFWLLIVGLVLVVILRYITKN